MAGILYEKVKNIEGIKVTQKVEANGVFVRLPKTVAEEMRKHYFFYPWDEEKSEYRWMTSWDTTEEDIAGFADLLSKEMKKGAK